MKAAGASTAMTAGLGHRPDDLAEPDCVPESQVAHNGLVGEAKRAGTRQPYRDDWLACDGADIGDRPRGPRSNGHSCRGLHIHPAMTCGPGVGGTVEGFDHHEIEGRADESCRCQGEGDDHVEHAVIVKCSGVERKSSRAACGCDVEPKHLGIIGSVSDTRWCVP